MSNGRVKYNNNIIRYKNSGDDNDVKDCRIDMYYTNLLGVLYMTDDFVSARKLSINSGLETVKNDSETIIYDLVYENENNDKRFEVLKQLYTFTGSIVTMLYDKKNHSILITRLIDTLKPELVKNKHLEFKFTPLGKVDPTASLLSSISLSTSNSTAIITLDSNQNINEIRNKIGVVDIKVFSPIADKVSYKMDIEIATDHKVRTDMGVLTCFTIPQDVLDLDNSDFNLIHLFNYEDTIEGLIPSSDISDADIYYIPIS